MDLTENIQALLNFDGRTATGASLEDTLRVALDDPDLRDLPTDTFLDVVSKITGLYMTTLDMSALRIAGSLERAMLPFLRRQDLGLEGACGLYETLHFLYSCNAASMADTAGFGPGVVAPFLDYLRRRRGPPRDLRRRLVPPFKLAYLCRYAHTTPGNPYGPLMQDVMLSLADHKAERYRPVLYAWLHHDDDMLRPVEQAGIPIRRFPEMQMADRIPAIEAALAEDGVDILITDMNSPVPAAVFEQRSAPVQVYYQLGTPYWPLSQIDHVMRVWEFDPAQAGFDPVICSTVNGPWDLAALAPPRDEAAIAAERERMPQTQLLFGSYGRLAKVTPDYLEIVASLLAACPDVGVAIGGSGNADLIRAFAAERALPPDRFRLHEGYADGQVWGWLLDVFMDTFPFQGGASCREMIAKQRLVVSTTSLDMKNLARERVGSLLANDPDDYLQIAIRLATDPSAFAKAHDETRRLLATVPDRSAYADRLDGALTQAIAMRRPSRPWPGRLRDLLRRR